eukprot:897933_1
MKHMILSGSIKIQQWQCASCTLYNDMNQTQCIVCDACNPANPNINDEWQCTSCTLYNATDKKRCVACDAQNPTLNDNDADDRKDQHDESPSTGTFPQTL